MKKIKILAIIFLIFSSQCNLLSMSCKKLGEELVTFAKMGSTEMVSLLIEEDGVDIDFQDSEGSTALMLAINNWHTEVAKLLFYKGADFNLKTCCGQTALMSAAYSGNIEIVRLFIEDGVDIDLQDSENITALMLAALHGHMKVVRLLLHNGADPNLKTRCSITALMSAAYSGHKDIVKLLIENGANINTRDDKNKTATDLARESEMITEDETLVSWYLNNCPSYSMLFFRFLESGELADVSLPHNLRAHTTILRARIPRFRVDSLRNVLKKYTKEQAVEFLIWIYTGLMENPENVGQICDRLATDFNFGNSIQGFKMDMQSLYNSKEDSGDFTVIVDDTEIRVHRAILAVHSDFFRKMILYTTDSSNKVTDRSGLSINTFNAIIELFYTGQISNLTEEIEGEFQEFDSVEFYQLFRMRV